MSQNGTESFVSARLSIFAATHVSFPLDLASTTITSWLQHEK